MNQFENEGDPFQGKGDSEQAQSGEDDETAADRVEDCEDQEAEEGEAEGDLEQEEHVSVSFVFMLSSGVLVVQEGQLFVFSTLVFIESTEGRFLVPP
jgi:hypothetical protein